MRLSLRIFLFLDKKSSRAQWLTPTACIYTAHPDSCFTCLISLHTALPLSLVNGLGKSKLKHGEMESLTYSSHSQLSNWRSQNLTTGSWKQRPQQVLTSKPSLAWNLSYNPGCFERTVMLLPRLFERQDYSTTVHRS